MARPRVRERLLDAAYALLSDEGAAALTTRGVAARAGTTEASVFNNFGDKAGLLRALIGERLPQLVDARDCVEQGDSAELRQWLCRVYDSAEAFYMAVVPLMAPFWAGSVRDLAGKIEADRLLPVQGALSQRLQALQRAGSISGAADVCALSSLFLGAALHSALHRVANRPALTPGGQSGSAAVFGEPPSAAREIVDCIYPLLKP